MNTIKLSHINGTIFEGTKAIATIVNSDNINFSGSEVLVILEGLDRKETIERIINDQPKFAKEFINSDADYFPTRRGKTYFSQLKKY